MRRLPVDANRCDCVGKYALICQQGNACLGYLSDVPCPDEITGGAPARFDIKRVHRLRHTGFHFS